MYAPDQSLGRRQSASLTEKGRRRALLAMADGAGELMLRHEGREEHVSVRRIVRDDAEMRCTWSSLFARFGIREPGAITFYGRRGFLPVPYNLDAASYARAICAAHRKVRHATVGELRSFLHSLLRSSVLNTLSHELRFRTASVDYTFRIPRETALAWWRDDTNGARAARVQGHPRQHHHCRCHRGDRGGRYESASCQ